MSQTKQPLVSIGLPVCNGEAYLPEALDSLLSQTMPNFEIILSDNASTDRTEEICHEYARLDTRIRFYRQNENRGAAANFNFTFEKSRGEFFKWAAHDDRCHPKFLERCVAILQENPSSVLAYPKVEIIDEQGEHIAFDRDKRSVNRSSTAERFSELVAIHRCYQVFGLFRRSALLDTPLIAPFAASDAILLATIALKGPFEEVEEVLYQNREHSRQSIRAHLIEEEGSENEYLNFRAHAVWFSPELRGKRLFPYWRMLREYGRAVFASTLSFGNKLRCLSAVRAFAWRHRTDLFSELWQGATSHRSYSSTSPAPYTSGRSVEKR